MQKKCVYYGGTGIHVHVYNHVSNSQFSKTLKTNILAMWGVLAVVPCRCEYLFKFVNNLTCNL